MRGMRVVGGLQSLPMAAVGYKNTYNYRRWVIRDFRNRMNIPSS